ncbi:MAG: NAD(P)-dependent oxidoreductase [Candidatus Woesearchaeota archaeon]
MMRIRIYDLEEHYHDAFRAAFADDEVLISTEPLSNPEDCEVLVVFISSHVTREVLDAMPSLTHVATMSTGFDHIDTAACAERSISVMNVPTYGSNTVAEHTFTLILALARKLPESIHRVRYELSFSTDPGLRGFDLEGKRLGLIGLGQIGSHVARMAKGFGMDVVVFDVFPNEALAASVGCRFVSFGELVSTSDVVSIHVPLNEHTRRMFDDDVFSKMKRGSLIINTSRGGIIDTEALVRALRNGTLSGAGLDVLEFESELEDDIAVLARDEQVERAILAELALLRTPNVLITPHNAFNSHEAVERIVTTSIENVRSALRGDHVNTVHGS